MKRSLALILSILLCVPGCAMRAPSAAVHGFRIPVPLHAKSRAPQEIPADYVSRLPVGDRVEVALKNGQRFKATFMGLEGDRVRLQKRTRLPEPPLSIPLTEIAAIGLDRGGTSTARAVLIGVGVGAATFFGILLAAIAASD